MPVAQNTAFKSVRIGDGGLSDGLCISDDGTLEMLRSDGRTWRREGYGAVQWDHIDYDSFPTDLYGEGVGTESLGMNGSGSLITIALAGAVYKSVDRGLTFPTKLFDTVVAGNDDFRGHASRVAIDNQTIHYGTRTDGMVLSLDGGVTFSRVTSVPVGVRYGLAKGETLANQTIDRPTFTLVVGYDNDGKAIKKSYAQGGVLSVVVDKNSPLVDVGLPSERHSVVAASAYGQGLFLSTDGGLTYTNVNPPTNAGGVSSVVFTTDGQIIASTVKQSQTFGPTTLTNGNGPRNSFLQKRDLAGVWTDITPSPVKTYKAVACDPLTPGFVITVPQSGKGIQVSGNNGLTWTPWERTLGTSSGAPWLAGALNIGTGFQSINTLQFDPTRAHRLRLTEGVSPWFADLDTQPGTVNWKTESDNIEHLVTNGVYTVPGNPRVQFNAWDRPLFSTVPGVYPDMYLSVDRQGNPSADFGTSWSTDYSFPDANGVRQISYSICNHQDPSPGGNGGDPYRSGVSNDGGLTLTKFPSIPYGSTNGFTNFGFGMIITFTPDNHLWIPANGAHPNYTNNGGVNWTEIELPGLSRSRVDPVSGKTVDDYANCWIRPEYTLHLSGASDKKTKGRGFIFVNGFGWFVTKDYCRTWTLASNPGWAKPAYLYDMQVKTAPSKANKVFACAGSATGTGAQNTPLRRSRDGAVTWDDLPIVGVSAFGFGKKAPSAAAGIDTIWAWGTVGTQVGLFKSTDDGDTFVFVTDDLDGQIAVPKSITGSQETYGEVFIAVSGWLRGFFPNV